MSSDGLPPSERIAGFVAGLRYEEIPEAARAAAKNSILDTIGCALHGSTLEWGRILRRVVTAEGGNPVATVWGTELRTSASHAALLNGTAAHSFELDDIHMGGMIHPGALSLSAAFAIADQRGGLDGRGLVAAVVCGCEIGARVGLAVGQQHFRRGFHPQGTVGVFTAAASAARAAGLDANGVQNAVGIAASRGAGLMAAQEGAMVKRMHSGNAAEAGVLATLLAEQGFTGIPDALEADFGGFCTTLGGAELDLGALTRGLGSDWEIEQLGFKAYASCSAAHTSLEGVRRLCLEHDLGADNVERVMIHASSHSTVHCGWDYHPDGVTAAQMNIPYGVARMILDRSVSFAQFTEEAIRDPAAIELASRVSVVPDPAIDELGPMKRYTVRIEILTTAGATVSCSLSDRPGSPAFPLSETELRDKFRGLADSVVGDATARQIEELVARIEDVDDVRDLTALLVHVPAGEDPGRGAEHLTESTGGPAR